MDRYSYKLNPCAPELPLYLCTIGVNKKQNAVSRPGGIAHHQLLFCREGHGHAAGLSRMIQRGDIYYLPPHTTHDYGPKDGVWITDWITFGGTVADQLMPEPGIWRPENYEWYESLIEKMDRNDLLLDYQANSVLLYELLLQFRAETRRDKGINVSRTRERLQPVLAYMQQNFAKPITIRELAGQIHVSDAQFCRIFRSVCHTRPTAYLNYLRISDAKKQMLTHPEWTIGEIAQRSGFGSASYFGRIFLRSEGITAYAWRSQHGVPLWPEEK